VLIIWFARFRVFDAASTPERSFQLCLQLIEHGYLPADASIDCSNYVKESSRDGAIMGSPRAIEQVVLGDWQVSGVQWRCNLADVCRTVHCTLQHVVPALRGAALMQGSRRVQLAAVFAIMLISNCKVVRKSWLFADNTNSLSGWGSCIVKLQQL